MPLGDAHPRLRARYERVLARPVPSYKGLSQGGTIRLFHSLEEAGAAERVPPGGVPPVGGLGQGHGPGKVGRVCPFRPQATRCRRHRDARESWRYPPYIAPHARAWGEVHCQVRGELGTTQGNYQRASIEGFRAPGDERTLRIPGVLATNGIRTLTAVQRAE